MSHDFLNQIKDADLKNYWVDVKNGHLVEEKKTFPKRLLYGFCKFVTLGFWKKSQGLERALKEVRRIIKEDAFPSTDYKLKEAALSKFDPYQKNQKIAKSIQKINTLLSDMPTFLLNPTDVENAPADLTSYAEKHMEKLHWETLLLLGDKTSKDNPKFALRCYEQAYKNRDWSVNVVPETTKIKRHGKTVSISVSDRSEIRYKDITGQTAYRLGVCYREGVLVEKDLVKSAIYITEAADREHDEACYELGVELLKGETPKEKQEGFIRLFQALQKRHEGALQELLKHEDLFDGAAYYIIGEYYRDGKDISIMGPDAERYFTEGAKKGYRYACSDMAKLIQTKPRPTAEEKTQCANYIVAAAEQGLLHDWKLHNNDHYKDWLKAEHYYALSHVYLGEKSLKCLQKAAVLGDERAFQEILGKNKKEPSDYKTLFLCYAHGMGCETNFDQALFFFDKSGETTRKNPIFERLINISKLVDKKKGVSGEKANKLFNKVWDQCQSIIYIPLRLKAYELAFKIPCDAADEKKKPWIVKLSDSSYFTLKPEEQALLSDHSEVIQAVLSGRWDSSIDRSTFDSAAKDLVDFLKSAQVSLPKESLEGIKKAAWGASVDLSQLPFTREHLEHLLSSLKTGKILDLNLAIEHIMTTDELQMKPLGSAVNLLEQETSLWGIDDLEDARALTGFLSTHAFPEEVRENLGIYWGKLFFSKEPSMREEALNNLKALSPKALDLRTCEVHLEDLSEIAPFCDLTRLAIANCTDAEIRAISSFANLEKLTLATCTDWTNEGAGELQKLKNLKYLNLLDCKLNREILKEIGEISHDGKAPYTVVSSLNLIERDLASILLSKSSVTDRIEPTKEWGGL